MKSKITSFHFLGSLNSILKLRNTCVLFFCFFVHALKVEEQRDRNIKKRREKKQPPNRFLKCKRVAEFDSGCFQYQISSMLMFFVYFAQNIFLWEFGWHSQIYRCHSTVSKQSTIITFSNQQHFSSLQNTVIQRFCRCFLCISFQKREIYFRKQFLLCGNDHITPKRRYSMYRISRFSCFFSFDKETRKGEHCMIALTQYTYVCRTLRTYIFLQCNLE